MMLPDRLIEDYALEAEMITPYHREHLQPASYDLHLGDQFMMPVLSEYHVSKGYRELLAPMDVAEQKEYMFNKISGVENFALTNFALASTVERVKIPDSIVGRVEGKSSLARLGLLVHITAGFIDPGFEGHITLELFCANPRGLVLHPGMPIAQIAFEELVHSAERPYGHDALKSKYQDQGAGPKVSQYWRNF